MAIQEVVDWVVVSTDNEAHHPTGPQGEKAIRTSLSFRELQAAIARFNASPVFNSPLIVDGNDAYIAIHEDGLQRAYIGWEDASNALIVDSEDGLLVRTGGSSDVALTINAIQASTFAAGITVQGTGQFNGASLGITNASTPFLLITDTTNTTYTKLQSQNTVGIVGTGSAHNFLVLVNDVTALTFTTGTEAATFAGQINAPAGTTAIASLNIAEGVAKTTPVDGDIWLTADGEFNARLNGRTVDLARGATLSNTWKFNTSTSSADPGSRNFSLNNATLGSVTAIYINSESDEKADANAVLGFLDTGHRLYIQQKDDADNVALFEVSGSTTDNTGWWTIPVTVVGSGTLYGSNKACGVSLLF